VQSPPPYPLLIHENRQGAAYLPSKSRPARQILTFSPFLGLIYIKKKKKKNKRRKKNKREKQPISKTSLIGGFILLGGF
jgi:hypothetical protein